MKNYIQLISVLTMIMGAHSFRASNNFRDLLKPDPLTGKNKITQVSETKVLRTKISPSSKTNIALINSKTEYLEGVCDWEKDRIDSEEMFIITKLRLGYDTNASANKEASLTYKKAVPASVRNAILTVNQDNKELFKSPISVLINQFTPTNLSEDSIELAIPIVLVDAGKFDFTLTYPEDAAAASGTGNENEYLEIVADGFNMVRSSTQK